MVRPASPFFLALLGGVLMLGGAARAEPAACSGIERELAERDRTIRSLTRKLEALAKANIRNVEKALHGTGIKVNKLIERGAAPRSQGGPFIPADPRLADVHRWDALARVMAVLPVATPLKDMRVASGFGKRRDPINRRSAMHEGIDLVAPLRSAVSATGPGVVTYAGTQGRYGKLVEIDHGMGVRTRYAHLGAIRVARGQKVAVGAVIGLVGSTGRSTGPHLHYEVRVDGKPNNPIRFIRAGVRLRSLP
jgi:murein DD-endopeptidase MepM/ murein hydrolase activator NlpD